MKAVEETFHYQESWIKSIFSNDGQFRIDSTIIAGVLGAGWISPWDIWQVLSNAPSKSSTSSTVGTTVTMVTYVT